MTKLHTQMIGQQSQCEFVVTDDLIRSFAASTQGDPDGGAHPSLAFVASFQAMGGALAGAVPPDLMMRMVHFLQDIRLERALAPGDRFVINGTLRGITPTSAGTAINVVSEIASRDDEPVGVSRTALMVRGFVQDGPSGEPFERLSVDGAPLDYEIPWKSSDDQALRYAEASGDNMPIHIDEDAARAAGFEGIILHGMCTLSIAVNGLAAAIGIGVDEIRRVSARFRRPVLQGAQLLTKIDHRAVAAGRTAFGFKVSTDEGEAIGPALVEAMGVVPSPLA